MKIAKSTSTYQIADEGVSQAVVVDVIDMGMREDRFNPGDLVHQVRLAFQTEETTDEGKPFVVSSYPFKASLNSKSNLYKVVKTILGRPIEKSDFDDEGEIDLDSLLIGKNVNVTIAHKESGESVYANAVDFGSLTSKQAKSELLVPKDYVRVQDREEKAE